jgi:hypothetical protein
MTRATSSLSDKTQRATSRLAKATSRPPTRTPSSGRPRVRPASRPALADQPGTATRRRPSETPPRSTILRWKRRRRSIMTTTAGRSSSALRTGRRRGDRLAFMMVESGHANCPSLVPLFLPAVPERAGALLDSCAAPAVGEMQLSDKFLLPAQFNECSPIKARLAPRLITGQKNSLNCMLLQPSKLVPHFYMLI